MGNVDRTDVAMKNQKVNRIESKNLKNRRKRMIVALKVAAMKNRNVVQKVVRQIRNQNQKNLDQNPKSLVRNPKSLDQNPKSVHTESRKNRKVRNPKTKTLALAVFAAHRRGN